MKFLVDECLHTSLVDVAVDRQHEAQHVSRRGLSGMKDWNLIKLAVDESFTFVTNNARDFRRLHGMEEAHAGLVMLIPFVEPSRQRELFAAVLDVLEADPDLFNEVIEAEFGDGDESVIVTRLALAQEV